MRYEHCPQITLSPEEVAQYDEVARACVRETVAAFAAFDPHRIDPSCWEFVTRRKQMSMYHSVQQTPNPSVLYTMGTGLVPGSMDAVMSGQYQDTTEDKLIADAILGYPFAGGGVLSVVDRRTDEDPYRFGGIKWMACTSVHGLMKDRDFLVYERMGQTVDTEGNPVAYLTFQSIRRPEFPMEAIPDMQRQHVGTCYLYRPRPDLNKTEVFLRGSVYQFGKYPRTVIYYGSARTWLSWAAPAKAGYAKMFSALMDQADAHAWEPSSKTCHVCSRDPLLGNSSVCAGCHQNVCRGCSHHRAIFMLDDKRKKPQKRLFCKPCIESVTNRDHCTASEREEDSDDDSISTESISTCPELSSPAIDDRFLISLHSLQRSASTTSESIRSRVSSLSSASRATWGSAGPRVPGADIVLDW